MDLQGKVAFVTGGAKRVGKAVALALAGKGCHVAICYRTSKTQARDTVSEIQNFGVKAIGVKGDLSKASDIRRMVKEIESRLGPVDILVNNASIFEKTPWPEVQEKAWDRHMVINLKAPFLLSRELAPGMVRRGRGKIVNLADSAVERPFKNYLPYLVSKAGLICMTKALAKELAPAVQVNAVTPGPVLLPVDMSESERQNIIRSTPLRRIGSPQDVAAAVLFLVEGTDFATGTVLGLDGGRLIG
jgi:NAD(P)-dependent dehydrogenase (short-subunit alcohol dehydrogenase family)